MLMCYHHVRVMLMGTALMSFPEGFSLACQTAGSVILHLLLSAIKVLLKPKKYKIKNASRSKSIRYCTQQRLVGTALPLQFLSQAN